MSYYSKSLHSNSLQKCYKIAPVRVQQYLQAEIQFVANHIDVSDKVLDIGCGYGRAIPQIAGKAKQVTGIDLSHDNIRLAQDYTKEFDNCELYVMDATDLKFPAKSFELVFCIQNGISAINIDPLKLITEAVRVTKSGGKVLFSTYAENFWDARLEWFELQAEHGLVGEIDHSETKNGMIVCKDGFTATTFAENDFKDFAVQLNLNIKLIEVDSSSLFCIFNV